MLIVRLAVSDFLLRIRSNYRRVIITAERQQAIRLESLQGTVKITIRKNVIIPLDIELHAASMRIVWRAYDSRVRKRGSASRRQPW